MQCTQILENDIIDVERKMFNFIWASRNTKGKSIDRIKRSLLKNSIEEGGLKVTDIDCLDRALKFRQYVRAAKCRHNISIIQLICLELCENTLDDYIINNDIPNEEWFAIFMQIIMTLITYQKLFSFTHNDLHTNNVMYIPTTKKFLYYHYKKNLF